MNRFYIILAAEAIIFAAIIVSSLNPHLNLIIMAVTFFTGVTIAGWVIEKDNLNESEKRFLNYFN